MEVSFQTPHLLIDEFVLGDVDAFMVLAMEPDVALHWAEENVSSESATTFVRQASSRRREPDRSIYELAVRLKPKAIIIGECDLGFFPGERDAELGFFIGKRHRDRGYAAEAVRGLLAFGFDELALTRIYAYCDVDNPGGAKVMKKAGLRRLGIERVHSGKSGAWRDGVLHEVLSLEYGRIRK